MSTSNPYNYPADFTAGWDQRPLSIKATDSFCFSCGSRDLDGASFVAKPATASWDWQCRICTMNQMDDRELTMLIERLARQPHLRAKLREILELP